MKTITTIVAAAIAAMALTAPHQAAAQRFGGGFRAPTVTYRPPAPVYRAPAPAYRPPAPAYVQRAPAVTYRQPAQAVRPPVPAAKPRPPVSLTRQAATPRASGVRVREQAVPPRAAAPKRSTYRYGSGSYAWTAPAIMPIWWMAAMHQPYTTGAYDRFIQECIRTPRERRSRECVRALRERGIAA